MAQARKKPMSRGAVLLRRRRVLSAQRSGRFDADELAQVKLGLCVMQIEYGTPWSKYCPKRATSGYYCAEHARDLREEYSDDPRVLSLIGGKS